jgi:site-specific recombinase XerD
MSTGPERPKQMMRLGDVEAHSGLGGRTRLHALVDDYLQVCRSRNLAAGTTSFYVKKLRPFVAYCEGQAITDISQITPDSIRGFLIQLSENRHRPGGVHCYFRAVRAFLRWFEEEQDDPAWKNPMDRVKPPKVPLEPLEAVSIDDVKSLTAACAGNSILARRDAAILLFLLDTGVRMAELLALNMEDVELHVGSVQVRCGKGGKPRLVYFGERTKHSLHKYLKLRNDLSPALWITRSGERLGQSGLQMLLRRRAKAAGVPVASPHDFRRASALQRWRAGTDILTISRLLGHSSLQVISRYIKQSGEDLSRAALMSSPVDRNL